MKHVFFKCDITQVMETSLMALRIKKYQHKQNNAILRKPLELEINKSSL